jgi:hypothetical protein
VAAWSHQPPLEEALATGGCHFLFFFLEKSWLFFLTFALQEKNTCTLIK